MVKYLQCPLDEMLVGGPRTCLDTLEETKMFEKVFTFITEEVGLSHHRAVICLNT